MNNGKLKAALADFSIVTMRISAIAREKIALVYFLFGCDEEELGKVN